MFAFIDFWPLKKVYDSFTGGKLVLAMFDNRPLYHNGHKVYTEDLHSVESTFYLATKLTGEVDDEIVDNIAHAVVAID